MTAVFTSCLPASSWTPPGMRERAAGWRQLAKSLRHQAGDVRRPVSQRASLLREAGAADAMALEWDDEAGRAAPRNGL